MPLFQQSVVKKYLNDPDKGALLCALYGLSGEEIKIVEGGS
jgi:hypothetical protein